MWVLFRIVPKEGVQFTAKQGQGRIIPLPPHSELKRDRPFDLHPDFILTLCSRLRLTQKHARVRLGPKQV